MKRYIVFLTVISVAGLSLVGLQMAASAQESVPMTEAHIERIRSNCVEAQSTLNQLHASDALLRVNRGQLYESMSTKLMVPFNSRVALNRLDSRQLLTIASRYEQELIAFRQTYQQYEEAMTQTLKINCTKQPVAFYDSLSDARKKRSLVHQNVLKLHKTIQDYKTEFEVFAEGFKEKSDE